MILSIILGGFAVLCLCGFVAGLAGITKAALRK